MVESITAIVTSLGFPSVESFIDIPDWNCTATEVFSATS